MALAQTVMTYAPVVPAAKAIPLSSEVIPLAGARAVLLDIDVGVTATTITVPRPGTMPYGGDARPTLSSGALTSSRWMVLLTSEFADANGAVTVNFSQTTNVTGRVVFIP